MGIGMTIAMAWRNLWRNRRRTLITLCGIVFGTFLAVLFTGMGDSMWGKMINLAARMGGGHVTIQHPEYLETPSLKRTVTGAAALAEQAKAHPRVKGVMVRVTGNALLAAGGNSTGAFFMAIDPSRETPETLSLLESIKEGELFKPGDKRGIVMGSKLAENLGLKLGRKVVYTMTDKKGEIVSGLGRLRGIIKTGSGGMDAAMFLVPISAVREALGYEADEATQVALFLDDHRLAGEVAAELATRVKGGPAVVTWDQISPELAGFIHMKVAGNWVMEIIIGILVAAGIFNTLFVSVMERRREFGIMMAIGYTPWQLFRLVMAESAWVAAAGLVLAAVVTAWPYHYFNTVGLDISTMIGDQGGVIEGIALEPIIKVAIYPENLVIIAVAVFITTLMAGLYPAWKAGRVSPVDSIKLV